MPGYGYGDCFGCWSKARLQPGAQKKQVLPWDWQVYLAACTPTPYRTDPFGVPTATQGSSTQPFGFTGEPRDAETGFVSLRARTYDPQLGRFLQRDPVVQSAPGSQGLHRYAYVNNSPVNATDPSGHCLQAIGAGAVVGFGAYTVTHLDGWELGEAARWTAGGAAAGGAICVGAGLPALATVAPIASQSTIATVFNYRELFFRAVPNAPRTLRVHHTLPQKDAHLLQAERGMNVNEVRYLRGVDRAMHEQITNEWRVWERSLGRSPTAQDVIDFAAKIEAEYGSYFWRP